ncbi:MAG TPA: FmdB family zinc ribbon protein [Acidimicrobiales bacterium]|nr:FmdB family zinc ribbon protein [Acidimicrobiales bacterium]
MPTYEYRCTECDHTFDAVQSFTDDPIEVCPTCGGRVRKLFGNVGIVFKGSGFYKTDSRSKQSAASTAGDSASSNGSDADKKSGGDKVSAGSKESNGSEGSSSKTESSSPTPAKPAVTASSSKASDS